MKIDSRTPMLPTQAARGARAAAMTKSDATSPAPSQVAPPASTPAPAGSPDAGAPMSPIERLAAYSTQLMERVDQAEKEVPAEERGAVGEIRTRLEEGLARLHHGMSGGTMKPEDIQRGVSNMFEQARTALGNVRARVEGPDANAAPAKTQPLEDAATTSGLAGRLADLQADMTATLFQGLGDDSPAARRDAVDRSGSGSIYGMPGFDGATGSGLDVAV